MIFGWALLESYLLLEYGYVKPGAPLNQSSLDQIVIEKR